MNENNNGVELPKNVLCIGEANYDITILTEETPQENKEYIINEKIEGAGGNALNVATLLAKWGIESHLSVATGSDSYGEKIRKEIEMTGIKTSSSEVIYEKQTALSMTSLNKMNSSKIKYRLSNSENSPHLKKMEFGLEPALVLLDGYEFHGSTSVLNKFINTPSIMYASAVNNDVVELCKYTKYIIATEEFADKVANMKVDFQNPNTLLMYYTRFKERYPRAEVIITLGKQGVLYTFNNEIKVMPGINVDIKDSSGADDSFVGAFIYSMLSNYDTEKAITIGSIAAAMACTEYGARSSLPNLNSVLAYYSQKMGVTSEVPNQPNA